ncbi:MAG: tRNA pseudouridine(55) synthase TruB [Solirubrobacterales bacterium]|nr:tRNA pseudouridine(55) synthase TruB [Solirubrobacterales bacterium]
MDPTTQATGVLVVDKPAGVTSHDVVARIRRETGVKVGHAGTLDPFATGVLLVLLGRATRLQRYLMDQPKTYEATARLGWRSSTGDPDGVLTETGRIPGDLALPTGTIRQMVPMTSAVKVAGERLYRRAHRGEHQEDRPVREVSVYRAELLESGRGEARYRVEVSAGTYVRTLIETLGDAYCSALRRTAVGPIGIDRAGDLLGPAEALSFLPRAVLNEAQARDIGHGRTLPIAELELPGDRPGGLALVHRDNLIAVAHRSGEEIRPDVVLEPVQ